MKLQQFYIDDIIKTALTEDINYIDSTTDLLIPEDDISEAYFLAKDSGVLAGVEVAARVFKLLDENIEVKFLFKDGDRVQKGDVIAEFKGNTAAMLKAERTSLNLIQHMSGIATYTRKCVDLVEGTNASVTDTRKTLPGLRPLQKYSVTAGGGKNHRYNLTDAAMLKDNHIDAYGGITAAVNALREKAGHMLKIEVEARTLDDVKEALDCKTDVIMLDNMSCEEMKKAVELTAGRAKLEASGNVTLDTIREIAETGVDIISLGALTHSVKAFDISMKWGKCLK
ncbi:MAG: carboxylating nicotinate-nucleotide diphosphorylase [Ruminococcaceae bacterium]|nr:carboxylating nicotinate-nucleotide diphosphorylase [Oscillospiraceae bacterium]